ncbi:portal protein [bacterium]|nr:portal protein [bacterium]
MADDNNSIMKLFGFELSRTKKADPNKENDKLPSIVPKTDDDGAGYVTASGSHYGQYIDINGDNAKDNAEMIMKYRGVATHPEVDAAIEDIINESVSGSENESPVLINLDGVETSDKIKKLIIEEFDGIQGMLNFNELGHDIFRSWYVDGRLIHHLVVNEGNMKAGIQEIRPIDATKIRKVKEVKYKKDNKTGAKVVDKTDEFYVFQEKNQTQSAVKLTPDSVSYVTSGLTDPTKKRVISYLHKAIKPINQLRMMEDSLVIYRLARAPERRIFYIDVGNLPANKAEQHMKEIQTRYRNKLVYDASTGNLKDDRKHMSMLEDFWLPRREGGRGTEISTLPGGDNLGQIDDIVYFQKRLYRALNVPINRLEQESQFSLGRSTEISRDEVKFQKFIDRLRRRFSTLFTQILKKQLILKGIITLEDWNSWKNDIQIDFIRDNHFTELKDSELLRERLSTLDQLSQYVGEYFSREWVMKNVMMMSEEDIETMKDQVEAENAKGGSDEEEY